MDFGSAPRLPQNATAPLVPRPDLAVEKDAVPVELAPDQTVQSAPAGEAVKLDIRREQRQELRQDLRQELRQDLRQDLRREQRGQEAAARRELPQESRQETRLKEAQDPEEAPAPPSERRTVIEPRTRSIVMEKRDPDTGETVQTVPDEATLKLRMFARQIAERAREDNAARQIERTA